MGALPSQLFPLPLLLSIAQQCRALHPCPRLRPFESNTCRAATILPWLQREVADLTRKAATAASDAQTSSNTAAESLLISEVELYAACIHARCSLAQGRDAEAFRAAQLVGGRLGLQMIRARGATFGFGIEQC